MKTMLKEKKIFAVVLSVLAIANIAMGVSPKSSVPFEKAVKDAQVVVSMNTNWTVYQAAGQSMEPLFGENSLLLVEKSESRDLQAGMIALYRDSAGDVVAHKIMESENGSFITKGINNRDSDPDTITAENLIGVVFGVMHTNGNGQSDLPVALGKTY